MTGRGRAGKGNSKPEQVRPTQSKSCSNDQGEQSPPPGATAKGNREQSSLKSSRASGNAHTTTTRKKSSTIPGGPISCGLKSTGDVKSKPSREPVKKTSTPVCKDTDDLKKTSTLASCKDGSSLHVKLKHAGEPERKAGPPVCKDTADSKKTSSLASGKDGSSLHASAPQKSRGAIITERKFNKNHSMSPSLDFPASSVEKKKEGYPAKNKVSPNKVLQTTLDKLKIKATAKSDSSSAINGIVDTVVKHMKEKSEHFRAVEKLCTGSYYENVKISQPDEFDVMLVVPIERVELRKFDEEGVFYSVALKRSPRDHPLRHFMQEDNTIAASEMLIKFREHVKKAVKPLPGVDVERKKPGCPAVTLLVKQEGFEIGLDIVLSLEVHSSWPEFTKDGFKIDSWLGTKVKKKYKESPFYLVPKYAGKGNEERAGVTAKDVWRISFSHVEKGILNNHGQAKTCCESDGMKCCRKPCLKLLKFLLHQLKEKHPRQLSKFFSYLCKTTLFHSCSVRVQDSDWRMDNLSDCFQQLLDDFVGHLRRADIPNFFIPTHNLLGSGFNRSRLDFLADCIEAERNNGFPIFSE